MTIQYIGAGALVQSANPTPSLPSGYQVDDLFILVTGSGNTVVPTIASGLWSLEVSTQYSPGGGATSGTIFYRYATSLSEVAPAITDSNASAYAQIFCYRGVFSNPTFAITNTVNTGVGTTATTTSVTTDRADARVITFITNNPKNSTWSTPTGTTLLGSNPTGGGAICGFIVADEVQSVPGPSTVRTSNETGSASVNWIATAVQLRPASSNQGMFFITP